jgi:hypothetical protein
MKKVAWIIPVLAMAAIAQEQSNTATFAAEWRVTGFVRHGQIEEASVEHAGRMPRFVREGDRLPDDILVFDINYAEHSVTLCKGNEKVVLHGENFMAPPPPLPKPLVSAPEQTKKDKKDSLFEKATAVQDPSGKWLIQFPNGKSMDMDSYVARHGGVTGSMQHVRDLMANETDPDRIEYRKQQLRALKSMYKSGMQ